MKNQTKETIEQFTNGKYRMIFEGIGVGLLTGLVVAFFRLGIEKAEAIRRFVVEQTVQGVVPVWTAVLFLCIGFLTVWLCVRYVPLCSGSGIPQVKGEMRGKIEENWWQVLFAKFIGGVTAIGAGLSLGREGPSIQLGAMVGKGFSRLTKKLRTEEKLLMTCGAGAGLSGAFCAPLAGVVFSLEELHKNFSTEILLSTMAASVTSDFISSYIFGLSPVFDIRVEGKLPLRVYGQVLLLGILLGVFGVVYNRVTALIQNFYEKIPRKSLRIAVPFLCVVLFAVYCPFVLGSGHSLVGQVSRGEFLLSTLVVLLLLKFVFSMLSFGSGAPGGIFLPLLVLGALSGGLFAQVCGAVFGTEEIYLANFVILGMAGLFASIVRAPVTGVILITEMTGDFENFLSLAVVSLAAVIVADLLKGIPIYDQLLQRMLLDDSDFGTTEETRSHKVLLQSDVYIGSLMDGQKIERMLLPKGCLVVSVQRGEREVVPSGGTVLQGGDKLLLLCAEAYVQEVELKLENICKSVRN